MNVSLIRSNERRIMSFPSLLFLFLFIVFIVIEWDTAAWKFSSFSFWTQIELAPYFLSKTILFFLFFSIPVSSLYLLLISHLFFLILNSFPSYFIWSSRFLESRFEWKRFLDFFFVIPDQSLFLHNVMKGMYLFGNPSHFFSCSIGCGYGFVEGNPLFLSRQEKGEGRRRRRRRRRGREEEGGERPQEWEDQR